MNPVLPHLRQLNYYKRPDYTLIYNCFLKLMKRLDIQWKDPYDWESATQAKNLVIFVQTQNKCFQHKARKEKPIYEDAKEFLLSDPLKINSPHSSDSKKRPKNDLADSSRMITYKKTSVYSTYAK